jgi:hypothetical protein
MQAGNRHQAHWLFGCNIPSSPQRLPCFGIISRRSSPDNAYVSQGPPGKSFFPVSHPNTSLMTGISRFVSL